MVEGYAKIIDAVASLLWPLIIILVALRFAPAVRSIIESAKWRKFTVKIGGQELTMEEIDEQQRALIADLQAQVASLRATPISQGNREIEEARDFAQANAERRAVLWVDDKPRNNSYIVQMLRERGVEVDLALSTEEGLHRFQSGRYGAVISDMGREESGRYQADAGIQLLKKIRERDEKIPYIIYCSAQKAREYRGQALTYGATHVTSSPTNVSGVLLRQLSNLDA